VCVQLRRWEVGALALCRCGSTACTFASCGRPFAKYLHDQLSFPMQEKTGLIRPADPQTIMYGDVSEYLAADAAFALLPLSLHVFTNPSPAPGWADAAYSDRRADIRCSQDICLPTFVQDIMVEASGVDWIKKTFDTSHSPFLSCPSELADYVIALAVAFAK